jgi:hypothetical protein
MGESPVRYCIIAFLAALLASSSAIAQDSAGPSPARADSSGQAIASQVEQDPVVPETSGEVVYDDSAISGSQATQSPWRFTFTQTADYGTNLTLPITLTPANTIIAPLGNTAAAGILNPALIDQLGLSDVFGLTGGVVPNTPAVALFQDDYQFQTSVGLQYRTSVGTAGSVSVGYGYYQNLHPALEQIDQNSHTASFQYAHRLSETVVGAIDYAYVYYLLAGDLFVTQNQVNLTLSWRQNELWSWQVIGGYGDANFRPTPFLNSDNYSGKLEAIRYLEDPNDYLTFGYAAGYSDAIFRGFAYQVSNVYASGRWLFGETNLNELRATAAYGIYDFFGTDPIDVGVERQDRILTLNLLLGRALSDRWTLFGSYTWLDSQSNVVRQTYDSSLISAGVTYVR